MLGARSKQDQFRYAGGFIQLSLTTNLSLTTISNPSANGNLKNHLTKVSFVFLTLLLRLLRVCL
jgi:hypothetical protein